ncbi:MAG: IS1595 family transposase [Phycisphaerae bacterium]
MSEDAARRYLRERCFRNQAPICPRCRGVKLYSLVNHRKRCAQCRYTFTEFAGRWLNIGSLRCAEWLVLLRSFAGGATVQDIQRRLGVVYTTAHRAVHTLRSAIAAHARDRERLLPIIMAPPSRREPMATGLVFGMIESAGAIDMRLTESLTISDILAASVCRLQVGQIVYTDPYDPYLGLAFWLDRFIDSTADSVVFWKNYEKLWHFRARRRRISAWQYLFHVKEMEFRFNHRPEDSFEILIDYLCDLLPSSTDSPAAQSRTTAQSYEDSGSAPLDTPHG